MLRRPLTTSSYPSPTMRSSQPSCLLLPARGPARGRWWDDHDTPARPRYAGAARRRGVWQPHPRHSEDDEGDGSFLAVSIGAQT